MSLKKIYGNKESFPEFNKLTYRKKEFVWYYLDNQFVEPNIYKPTKNDAFASYIASHKNHDPIYNEENNPDGYIKIIKYVFNPKIQKMIKVHDTYEDFDESEMKVVNAEKFKKHLMKAQRLERECQPAITEIRAQILKTDEKSRELEVMDAVHTDSLYHRNPKYKIENRKLAFKMYGLDKQETGNQINIYEASGKRVIQAIKNSSGGESDNDMKDLLVDDSEFDNISINENELKDKKEK